MALGNGDLIPAVLMQLGQGFGEVVGSGISDRDIQGKGGPRVVSIVGKEWGDLGGGMGSIVIGKFSQREPSGPIVLLIADI